MLDDIERILFHEQTILSRLDELAAEITEQYRGQELTVIAVLNGSLIFAADLLRRIALPLRLDCLRVASYHGGTESTGQVTFHQLNPAPEPSVVTWALSNCHLLRDRFGILDLADLMGVWTPDDAATVLRELDELAR